MNQLSKKSIHTLELPRVLEMLAAEATSIDAKEAAMALEPVFTVSEVAARQKRTSDAKHLIGRAKSPSFDGLCNISSALSRSEIGGILSLRELLDINSVLRLSRNISGYEENGRVSYNALNYLFDDISVNKYLEDRISSVVQSDEEVYDTASPELSDIRRKKKNASAKIRESLQKLISSAGKAKYLQENIITQRFGRYVVPVKSEYKSEVSGIVHDTSSSGQTLFIEPTSVVELNNLIRELEGKEKKEIERILMILSGEVSTFSESLLRNYSVLVMLDLIFAMAKLSYKMNAEEPVVNEKGQINLIKARHPLLDIKKAIPIDVRLGEDFDTLIITGPNTGGKTVTLKTIGLLTLMAECGLHIPASTGSKISIFKNIYADIGDEQSIEQSLSTFSSHMTNIVMILDGVDDETLVLFDELGAGTDPIEGAALATAIIEYARSFKAKIAATTHYAELKSYALTTKNVENAACEFDVSTLAPTYRLLIGVPGKSNAFAISQRLGLNEHIIGNAKEMISRNDEKFEEVLKQIEEKRTQVENQLTDAEKMKIEAERINKEAKEFGSVISRDRERELEKAKAEAKRIVADAKALAEQTFKELSEIRKLSMKEEDTQRLNQAKSELKRVLNQGEKELSKTEEKQKAKAPSRPLKIGDTVYLLNFGTNATVLTLPDKLGNLTVQAGILKATVKLDEVELVENTESKKTAERFLGSKVQAVSSNVKPEIDLRGMTTDEAVAALSLYLDTAYLRKLNQITVIHGKGTGAVRSAVQQHLKSSKYVKSFRLGTYGEGDVGVTIAELK